MKILLATICLLVLGSEAKINYQVKSQERYFFVETDRRLFTYIFDYVPPQSFRGKKLVSYEKMSDNKYLGYYR